MTSPFPLPILFTAWTWHDGAGIAGEVIRRARLGGFKSVAVQLSESTPDDATDDGRTLDPGDVKAMRDAGLFVVGWDIVSADTAHLLETLPLQGWCPQVESMFQREPLYAALRAGVGAGLPKALVTTYGGLDTAADVVRLRELWPDVYTFVECYKADGFPHEQIDRMLDQGRVYSFDRSRLRALVGTYRGEMPTDYPGLDAADYGGAYLEESMSDTQLRAFAQIVPALPAPQPTPEEPVSIPDPAKLCEQISLLAESWLQCFDEPHPLARLRSILEIAETTSSEWYAVRQDVVDALAGKVGELRRGLAAAEEQVAHLAAELEDAEARIARAKAALG